MGASVGYHRTGEEIPVPAAPPLDHAGFDGGLVLAAVATAARKMTDHESYQTNQFVVAMVPTTRRHRRWDECGEAEEPADCCHMGAAQGAVEVARHGAGDMETAAAAHSPGMDRAHKAAGTVARRHRRILSGLRAAAGEAPDAAHFPPKDATCRSCRSSGFSAPHP